MSTVRNARRKDAPKAKQDTEIIVRLNTPEELFEVSAVGLFSPKGRYVSGIDELVQELTPRRLRPGLRAVLVVPADRCSPALEVQIRKAMSRYCRLRLRQTELARKAQWQDVMSAFRVGVVIFAAALLISYYFNASGLAALTKLLLGDGFFLVIAWVGLWYPLDALVHYRRQSAREEEVLSFIGSMDVTVQAETAAASSLLVTGG